MDLFSNCFLEIDWKLSGNHPWSFSRVSGNSKLTSEKQFCLYCVLDFLDDIFEDEFWHPESSKTKTKQEKIRKPKKQEKENMFFSIVLGFLLNHPKTLKHSTVHPFQYLDVFAAFLLVFLGACFYCLLLVCICLFLLLFLLFFVIFPYVLSEWTVLVSGDQDREQKHGWKDIVPPAWSAGLLKYIQFLTRNLNLRSKIYKSFT